MVTKVHKNTVRGWLKSGLETVDARRPTLVLGRKLSAFLHARRQHAAILLKQRKHHPPALVEQEHWRPALNCIDFDQQRASLRVYLFPVVSPCPIVIPVPCSPRTKSSISPARWRM